MSETNGVPRCQGIFADQLGRGVRDNKLPHSRKIRKRTGSRVRRELYDRVLAAEFLQVGQMEKSGWEGGKAHTIVKI